MIEFCSSCGKTVETSPDSAKGVSACSICGNTIRPLASALSENTMVANFRIIREIGRGGMGIVYCACQENLKRNIALKILSDELAGKTSFVESFFNEARAAANLSHPNIVQAYDAGTTPDGLCYFAMELIEGETLDQNLLRNGAFPLIGGLRIARDIADALSYAWNSREMCHGDIKPDNILLDSSGICKLADFGLAKSMHETRTENREMMVTPLYASPEIITGKAVSVNMKSDMYSFGATFYHVLAGTPLFSDSDINKIYLKHVQEIPQKLSERNPAIPPQCNAFFDSLLAKDPAKRPDSWEEIAGTLQDLIDLLSPRSKPGTEIKKNKSLKKIISAAACSAAVLALVLVSLFVFLPKKQAAPKPAPPVKQQKTEKKLPLPSSPQQVQKKAEKESAAPPVKKLPPVKKISIEDRWQEFKKNVLSGLPPEKSGKQIELFIASYASENSIPPEIRQYHAACVQAMEKQQKEDAGRRKKLERLLSFGSPSPGSIKTEEAERLWQELSSDPVFMRMLKKMPEKQTAFRIIPEKIRKAKEDARRKKQFEMLRKEFDSLVKGSRKNPEKLDLSIRLFLERHPEIPKNSVLYTQAALLRKMIPKLDEKKYILRYQNLLKGKSTAKIIPDTVFEDASQEKIRLRFRNVKSITKVSYTQKNKTCLMQIFYEHLSGMPARPKKELTEHFIARTIWNHPENTPVILNGRNISGRMKKQFTEFAEILLRTKEN